MNWTSAIWSAVPILLAALVSIQDQVMAFVAGNPKLTMWVAAIYAVILHFLRPPTTEK